MVSRYQKRISGPLLDRIDTHFEVPRVEYERLSDDRPGEPFASMRWRVEAAWERQARRSAGTPLLTNAGMGPAEVRVNCPRSEAGRSRSILASTSPGRTTASLPSGRPRELL